MSLAWSEYLRSQIERPLLLRDAWFAVVSALFLLPLSFVWSALAAVRARKRKKLSAHHGSEPWVISVGNVSVGGSGKSPIVRSVARLALNSGYDVGVFTRGVGRNQGQPFLLCIDSSSQDIPTEAWEKLSDETMEHLLQLRPVLALGAKIWFAQGVNRSQLLNDLLHARKEFQLYPFASKQRPLMILVDDGLQQTALPVHRDVVVWDPHSLTSAPRFALPFGPYRSGWRWARPWGKSLPHADIVVWSRMRSAAERSAFEDQTKRAASVLFGELQRGTHSDALRQKAMAHPQTQFSAVEKTWLARVSLAEPAPGFGLEAIDFEQVPSEVSLLCGIARPDRFKKSFLEFCAQERLTPQVVGVFQCADHGELDPKVQRLLDENCAVLTTLKDLCRWWKTPEFKQLMKKQRLFVLSLEVDLISAATGASGLDVECFFPGSKEQVNHD
ncbi:MAG: hypothetical protein FJY29_02320 [Betaproteobacteria bacterium]|nr:hypothetical protein [Betaproteobacteria bacterium]